MLTRVQDKTRWMVSCAVAVAAGAAIWTMWIEPVAAPPANAQATQTREWRTAAPGIVEARVAEVKLAAATLARISTIAVKAGDLVKEGDLLVQFDDQEEAARVRLAEANVALRKIERNSAANADATERRLAEDAVARAEEASRERRTVATQEEVKRAKRALSVLTAPDAVTAASRADALLAVANAELALAQAAHAKTRITAPFAGTVLKLHKRAGEMASPSGDDAILTFGDQTHLRIRAELSELDIGHVKVDDRVSAVSNALPGRKLAGRVTSISSALGTRRIGASSASGPLWPSVREIIIELDDTTSLIPGLHVDVFFGPDAS
jgi:HlyD family secretion protein